MKKVFKKNQIIITALAIMIAVAGYINYSDNHLGIEETLKEQNAKAETPKTTKEKKEEKKEDAKGEVAATDMNRVVKDINSLDYDVTDETAVLEENHSASAKLETPGEAVLAGATTFAAQAKVSREQIRSANKATLLEIMNNTALGETEKQEAVASMVKMTDLAEQEAAIELLLEAKGFQNAVVNLTGETADVIVPQSDMEDAKRAQIEDIVKRKSNIVAENIVITPLSDASE